MKYIFTTLFFVIVSVNWGFCSIKDKGIPKLDSVKVISEDEDYRLPYMHITIDDFVYFFNATTEEVKKYEPCMFTITDDETLEKIDVIIHRLPVKDSLPQKDFFKMNVRIGLKLYYRDSTTFFFIEPKFFKSIYSYNGVSYKKTKKFIRCIKGEIRKQYECGVCKEEERD